MKLREKFRETRRAKTSDGIFFFMQGYMNMVILGLNKRFLVKVSPVVLLSSTKIGCLTISLKEGIVVNYHILCLLVLSVERSTRVSA